MDWYNYLSWGEVAFFVCLPIVAGLLAEIGYERSIVQQMVANVAAEKGRSILEARIPFTLGPLMFAVVWIAVVAYQVK